MHEIVSEHRSSALRVLQIVAAAGEAGSSTGGVNGPERRAANTVALWATHDIEMLIAYPRRGTLQEIFEASGSWVADFEISGKLDVLAPLRIASLARRLGADVLHTQGPGSLDALASLGAVIVGIPHVVTRPVLLEDLIVSNVRKWLYDQIDFITRLTCASMIFVSARLRDRQVRRNPILSERSSVIANGVALSKYRAYRRRSSNPGMHVVSAAQLRSEKDLGIVIQVISRLRALGLEVTGTIWGDGPERTSLISYARSLGVSSYVQLPGHTNSLPAELGRGDVFLFTSRREGLSVAVIEALAVGLPIIATEVAAIRDQVEEGENGFVVAPGDVDAMVTHLAYLYESPGRRLRLGTRSAALADERFGEDRMVSEYAAVYHEVARNRVLR